MVYQKIHVDNTTCLRRFHITFDTESPPKSKVQLQCQHCGQEIFVSDHHPEVRLVRDENLIGTGLMSRRRISSCQFRDNFSPDPVPKQ